VQLDALIDVEAAGGERGFEARAVDGGLVATLSDGTRVHVPVAPGPPWWPL
jgi:hypothetical protein